MSHDVFFAVFPLWLKAFALTQSVEVPIYWAVARRKKQLSKQPATWRVLLAAAAGTTLTHPLFWFVWPLVIHDYTTYMISGELIVTFVEIFVFWGLARPIGFRIAVAAAVLANSASYLAGLLLRFMF